MGGGGTNFGYLFNDIEERESRPFIDPTRLWHVSNPFATHEKNARYNKECYDYVCVLQRNLFV
jgi:hypothetical protein